MKITHFGFVTLLNVNYFSTNENNIFIMVYNILIICLYNIVDTECIDFKIFIYSFKKIKLCDFL